MAGDVTADLVSLANSRDVVRISLFAETAEQMDVGDLVLRYERQRESAPSRALVGKRYFVGHRGVTSSSGTTNRIEEHLAVALANLEVLKIGTARTVRILDYQVPLKAAQSDAGIGKIDLLGCRPDGRLEVIELKVERSAGVMGETPLRALLEGLAYAAIVHANEATFTEEAAALGLTARADPPAVTVAAPTPFWQRWTEHRSAERWVPAIDRLISDIREALQLEVSLVDLGRIGVEPGIDGKAPQLIGQLQPKVLSL